MKKPLQKLKTFAALIYKSYIYVVGCFLLKYRLIFLQVLKVSDEPLGESNIEGRVKDQPEFQKKAPNDIFAVILRYFKFWWEFNNKCI